MNKIRLVIADDHQMFRMGIANLLANDEGVEVVGEASDGTEIVEVVRKHNPDVILMDISLPEQDGIAATKAIIAENPNLKVLALTSFEDEESVLNMINAGAKGYVLKDAPIDELVLAIRTIAKGNSYFAKEVSTKLFAMLKQADISFLPKERMHKQSLTERELEVLKHIAEELTNKEIAAKLFISPRTVETHRRNLINKLKVKNTAGLVKYYLNVLKDTNNGPLATP